MNKDPVVLIITAECGEPQLAEQKKQVKLQEGVICQHAIISNLTTLQAEKRIFEIARDASEADWILRLDGDMTFKENRSVSCLVDEAEKAGRPDRYSVPVDDYYTGMPLMGVHLMRAGSISTDADIREYRPEQWIQDLKGVTNRRPDVIHVNHGYDPDPDQLIRFALHRALKASEGHLLSRHWITLNRVRIRYQKNHREESLRLLYISVLTGLEKAVSGNDILGWSSVDHDSETNQHVKEEILERARDSSYSPDARMTNLIRLYLKNIVRKTMA